MPRGGRIWSTHHTRDDLRSYWSAAHEEAIHELKIDLPEPDCFEGQIWNDSFGSCSISIIHNGKQTLRRTREAVSRNRQTNQFTLVFLKSGHILCEQYGSFCEIDGGASILVDGRGEYRFTNPCPCEHLVLTLPEKWLQNFVNNPEEGVAKPITLATPWGAALNATLRALAVEPIDKLFLPHQLIANQIAGLLALVIGPSNTSLTTHSRKIYLKALQQIEALAHDPNLDAGMLAASLNISIRYLHALFATAGTTYGHQLLRVRMERAMHMLNDKHFSEISIAKIGAACGFNDPSHFARRFRERFHQAPGAYRTQQLGLAVNHATNSTGRGLGRL